MTMNDNTSSRIHDIAEGNLSIIDEKSPMEPPVKVTILAKWGKERITLQNLDPKLSIGQVKELISERTNILPKRQKLMGFILEKDKSLSMKLNDDTMLKCLKVKKKSNKSNIHTNNDSNVVQIFHEVLLMGTPEEKIFIDPSERSDLPDVVDDFDFDFSVGSTEVRIDSNIIIKLSSRSFFSLIYIFLL